MPTPPDLSSKAGALKKVAGVGGLVVVLLLGVLLFVRPTTVSTGPDQVALHYSDGAFTPRRFKDCVSPSTRAWDGPGATLSRQATNAFRSLVFITRSSSSLTMTRSFKRAIRASSSPGSVPATFP